MFFTPTAYFFIKNFKKMVQNIIYHQVAIDVEQNTSIPVVFPKGILKGVYFIHKRNDMGFGIPSINIGMTDTNGNVILPNTDYEDYLHKQGGYMEGMKPLLLETNASQFWINITSDDFANGNISASEKTVFFKGQLIFVIEQF